jgi:hypothetical protein
VLWDVNEELITGDKLGEAVVIDGTTDGVSVGKACGCKDGGHDCTEATVLGGQDGGVDGGNDGEALGSIEETKLNIDGTDELNIDGTVDG